jgi:hypothetical protein
MTMPRWRTQTWAFIIFNVVMVGLVWLVLSSFLDSSYSCDHIPYGSDRTACAMSAGFSGAIEVWVERLAIATIVIIWSIGFIVIGTAWLVGRGGRAPDTSRPDGLQEHLHEDSKEAEAPSEETQDDASDADD